MQSSRNPSALPSTNNPATAPVPATAPPYGTLGLPLSSVALREPLTPRENYLLAEMDRIFQTLQSEMTAYAPAFRPSWEPRDLREAREARENRLWTTPSAYANPATRPEMLVEPYASERAARFFNPYVNAFYAMGSAPYPVAAPYAPSYLPLPPTRVAFESETDNRRMAPSFATFPRETEFGTRSARTRSAVAEVEDRGTTYRVRFEMPGATRESLKVRVSERTVDVRSLPAESPAGEESYVVFTERGMPSFERQVQLPEAVLSEKVQARFQDGILELTLPKAHPSPEITIK